MSLIVLNDIILFQERQSLIKTLLYIKLCQKGKKLPENDINILSLFVSDSDKDSVIETALERKFAKSWQAADNIVSKLVKLKLLHKFGWKQRKVDPELFPYISAEQVAATFKLHNIKT